MNESESVKRALDGQSGAVEMMDDVNTSVVVGDDKE